MTVSLAEGIEWVGYVDWNIRDFHSFHTRRGATYNAYLVRDEHSALIDTVKAPYAGELLRQVAARLPLEQVSYVVCNHAEPDHSGALPQVMAALPNATLICDAKCAEILGCLYDSSSWRIKTVANGEQLALGRRTLTFVETPMLHWPDSMFTYVPEDKILFSMDAFGQHYASSLRFDDENPLCTVLEEAKAYYANIVMPLGKLVTAVLKKAAELPIAMIAPSHGVIWRAHLPVIVQAYSNWAACRPKAKVLIIYDTMWEGTGRMAQALAEGAARRGVAVKLLHARRTDLTDLATEVLDAAVVAVGSPTLNREMMPMVAAALTYLRGLKPVGKVGLAFGSSGWAKGGAEKIEECLTAMGWELLREPLRCHYAPTAAVLDECRAAGSLLADKALALGGDRQPGERVCVDP